MSSSPEDCAPVPGASSQRTRNSTADAEDRGSIVRRHIAAFGRFWWEFLVGDTPELLVGSFATVGIVAILTHNHSVRVVTVGALPVLVLLLLTASVGRAVRQK